MKNACIVLRNIKNPFYGDEFEPCARALSEGGYFLDKIFILGEDEPSAFAQTLIEAKNFFDNVFIVIPEHIFAESKVRVFEVLKAKLCDGNAISLDAKTVFLLRTGERGAAEIRSEFIDLLDAKYSVKHDKMVVRTVGVPQDRLQNVLSDCKRISGEKLLYNVYQCDGDMRLELLYDSNSPKMLIDDVMRVAVQGLNDYIYAVEDTPLNERVFEILKLRGLKLGIAESFTGGGVAKKLIEVPGVSSVLFESVVAYDNLAKEKRLGVQKFTLMHHGAVSDETAYEMAAGLLAGGSCNVSVATTGIAGPKSDNTNKPVGLCYIAVGRKENVFVYKYIFRGDREQITRRAVNQALFLLYNQIK